MMEDLGHTHSRSFCWGVSGNSPFTHLQTDLASLASFGRFWGLWTPQHDWVWGAACFSNMCPDFTRSMRASCPVGWLKLLREGSLVTEQIHVVPRFQALLRDELVSLFTTARACQDPAVDQRASLLCGSGGEPQAFRRLDRPSPCPSLWADDTRTGGGGWKPDE